MAVAARRRLPAQAYVLNATVLPSSSLSYLNLWAAGGTQPGVSTLNANDGAITSNMAIVPTSNGSIDAFATRRNEPAARSLQLLCAVRLESLG